MYRDFRELLDRNDIDAVLIATGPNWHATAAMNAAKAGKDMYCEKPCTKNIAQSLILAETMRRTGRVFQAGTQRRNLPHFAFACELARTGKLGKLKKVYAHPAGMQAMMSGWLPAGAGAGQGSRRLGHVPRPGGLAAVQREAARRLQFRKGWRAGRRRRAGMGLALRGPLPMGRRRLPAARRIQPAERRATGGALRERRGADLPRDGLDSARLVPGAVRRRDRLGRSGRQRQDRAELAGVARRAERSPKSAATRRRSTSAISSTA